MRGRSECKVVIVTNYNDADVRRAAHEAGAGTYFTKVKLIDLRRLFTDEPVSDNYPKPKFI